MSFENLAYEASGRIATITIRRPAVLNVTLERLPAPKY